MLCIVPGLELSTSAALAYCQRLGLSQDLGEGMNVAVISSLIPTGKIELSEFVECICYDLCEVLGIKSVNLLAVGKAAQVAIEIALHIPRTLRRLILLDPEAPIPLSSGMRLLLVAESVLPKQFSIKNLENLIDFRSSLHRVRCPTAVLWSHQEVKSKRAVISKYLWEDKFPNVWCRELFVASNGSGDALSAKAGEEILQFLQVPLKMSQKRLTNV